jgi:hypothetical protein
MCQVASQSGGGPTITWRGSKTVAEDTTLEAAPTNGILRGADYARRWPCPGAALMYSRLMGEDFAGTSYASIACPTGQP